MDIYEKFSLQPVINASGKMTILGVSTMSEQVAKAMEEGGTHFFVMKDLLSQAGQYIANLLGVEAALPVASASAGIAQAVASIITKDSLQDILHLYQKKEQQPREILLAKGHNVNYGVPVEIMVELGGGVVIESGYANECTKEQVELSIGEKTAGLLFIQSHHCVQKSMASIEDYVHLAEKYNIPLIVDAAAEEDLVKYYEMGAHMVIYSGAKALEGPTSGLVIGRKQYIEHLKLQGQGIGRAMKIGKESVLGLVTAVERYLSRQPDAVAKEMIDKVYQFNAMFDGDVGMKTKMVKDNSGREIYRSEITFDNCEDAVRIAKRLKTGPIAIYTRDYRANEGKIEIDVRSVTFEQLKTIYNNILKLCKGE